MKIANMSPWMYELTLNRQGGQLVHNAAEQLSADSSAKVSAGMSNIVCNYYHVYG
jgi:hypothetical protein